MKKSVGLIGILFSGLCLAGAIYMLRVLQAMDKLAGSWYTDAWNYAKDAPCMAALLLTAGILAVSVFVFAKGE